MTRARRPLPSPIVTDDPLLGRIEVRVDRQRPSVRLLDVDGHRYGAVDLDDPGRLELDYLARMFALVDALLPAGPCTVLHLGGGAFALPRALADRRPELSQTVVERSDTVLAVAVQHLGLTASPRLRVVHGDARAAVDAHAGDDLDAIVSDAYIGNVIPPHLATAGFAAAAARALRPAGVYVVNLVDAPPWTTLGRHAAAVRTALPNLLAVGDAEVARLDASGNVLLAASRRPLHRATVAHRLADGRWPSVPVASKQLAALVARARAGSTDDG